jgi:hypothetical protein
MDRDGPAGRGLVDAIIVGGTSIASLGTAGPIATSTTRAGAFAMAAFVRLQGGVILMGSDGDGQLQVILVGVEAVALGGSSDVASLEIEATGVANHGTRGGTSP